MAWVKDVRTLEKGDEVGPEIQQVLILHESKSNFLVGEDAVQVRNDKPVAMIPEHFLPTIHHHMLTSSMFICNMNWISLIQQVRTLKIQSSTGSKFSEGA